MVYNCFLLVSSFKAEIEFESCRLVVLAKNIRFINYHSDIVENTTQNCVLKTMYWFNPQMHGTSQRYMIHVTTILPVDTTLVIILQKKIYNSRY